MLVTYSSSLGASRRTTRHGRRERSAANLTKYGATPPNSSRTRKKTCAVLTPCKRKRCVHIHRPCIHSLRIGCELQEHSGDSNYDGGGNSMGTVTATGNGDSDHDTTVIVS